jgi:hypothetical protein
VPDPDVLQPSSIEFYRKPTLMPEFYTPQPPPPGGWPKRNSLDALERAANAAHDNVRKMVGVNDRMRKDQLDLIGLLKKERRWRRWLIGALVATWSALGLLLKVLLPYLVKGILAQ